MGFVKSVNRIADFSEFSVAVRGINELIYSLMTEMFLFEQISWNYLAEFLNLVDYDRLMAFRNEIYFLY